MIAVQTESRSLNCSLSRCFLYFCNASFSQPYCDRVEHASPICVFEGTTKNRWPEWVWILIGKTDLGFRVFVATQGRSVCLKEQRRICSLSEYEFWSPICVFEGTAKNQWSEWVWILISKTDLGFRVFVATQGRSVCLKEQRRICSLSEYEFWSGKTFWVLGFLNFFFFGFFCSVNKWLLIFIWYCVSFFFFFFFF